MTSNQAYLQNTASGECASYVCEAFVSCARLLRGRRATRLLAAYRQCTSGWLLELQLDKQYAVSWQVVVDCARTTAELLREASRTCALTTERFSHTQEVHVV